MSDAVYETATAMITELQRQLAEQAAEVERLKAEITAKVEYTQLISENLVWEREENARLQIDVAELAAEIARLEKDKATQAQMLDEYLTQPNPGDWCDRWGACKVCGGEIPDGHRDACHVWKMEQKDAQQAAEIARLEKERETVLKILSGGTLADGSRLKPDTYTDRANAALSYLNREEAKTSPETTAPEPPA